MPCCKVTRVIEDYGINLGTDTHENVSQYFIDRWQAGELGYRSVARLLNKRMLRSASVQAGRQVTDPQIESEYAALQGDDPEDAAEVRTALDSAGIDVEALEDSFLSHMAIRRHFQGCLAVEPPERNESSEWQREAIPAVRDQFEARIAELCRSLAHNDIVPDAAEATIQLPIYLRCASCPTRTPIEEAIEQGYVCEDHS
jgi:hypothetical protein